MKNILKSLLTISALSSVFMTALVINVGQASAETQKGTDANYIGAGITANVTEGGKTNDAPNIGGNITGRLKLGSTPLSARGNVLWNGDTTAIIPEVSLDLAIANRTNVFVTGGYSFVEKEGLASPLGNRDSVVVGAGVESEVGKNFLLYSNAKVGLRAYQDSSASAISVSGGIGYRF